VILFGTFSSLLLKTSPPNIGAFGLVLARHFKQLTSSAFLAQLLRVSNQQEPAIKLNFFNDLNKKVRGYKGRGLTTFNT